jgi:hypothetical protein
LRDQHDDRFAIARVQHQQEMGMPEGDDVLRNALDVLHPHVPDAQRAVQSSDELCAKKIEDPIQAMAPVARSSAWN